MLKGARTQFKIKPLMMYNPIMMNIPQISNHTDIIYATESKIHKIQLSTAPIIYSQPSQKKNNMLGQRRSYLSTTAQLDNLIYR